MCFNSLIYLQSEAGLEPKALSLICYKEDVVLTPVSPGCCKIFSSHNGARRYLLLGTFPPSSQPYRLRTPAPAETIPNFCGPWPSCGSWPAGTHVWEVSSECCLPVCLKTSLLPFSWSEVTSGAMFRKEPGVWLLYSTSRVVFPTTLSRLWRRVWNVFRAGFMFSMFWSFWSLPKVTSRGRDTGKPRSQVWRSHSWVLPQVLSLELVFLKRELEHYLSFGPSKIYINLTFRQKIFFLPLDSSNHRANRGGKQLLYVNTRSLGWSSVNIALRRIPKSCCSWVSADWLIMSALVVGSSGPSWQSSIYGLSSHRWCSSLLAIAVNTMTKSNLGVLFGLQDWATVGH